MACIYSHLGIESNVLNQKFETVLDTGEVVEYTINYNPSYVVNMPFVNSNSTKKNKCNWLRDHKYFFDKLLEDHPELFSDENVWAIQEGETPMCDSTFVKYFPEYEPMIGEKLKHHHIGEDGQAIALPASLHKGYGVVHNSEKIAGVTKNGHDFSDNVKDAVDSGVEFKWEEANNYIVNKQIDLTESKTEKIEDIQRKNEQIESCDNNNNERGYDKLNSNRNKRLNLLTNVKIFIKKNGTKILIGGALALAVGSGGYHLVKSGKGKRAYEFIEEIIKNGFGFVDKSDEFENVNDSNFDDDDESDNISDYNENMYDDEADDDESEFNGIGLSKKSVYYDTRMLFKNGEIDKEEAVKRLKAIESETGVNLNKYLNFIKRFDFNHAKEIEEELKKDEE